MSDIPIDAHGVPDAQHVPEAHGVPPDASSAASGPTEWIAEVIEHLPDAAFVIDQDKRVAAWNRACE